MVETNPDFPAQRPNAWGRANDYQIKAAKLNALSEIEIKMRGVDDWYVHQSVEVKKGGFLKSAYGNGATPEEAINSHWKHLVEDLPSDEYLVTNAYDDGNRKAVRWNGFMWEEVREKTTATE